MSQRGQGVEAALGLYERLALSLTRSAERLEGLTMLPSTQVRSRLDLLVGLGLVELDGDQVTLPPVPVALAGVEEATRGWLQQLQEYWLAWRPSREEGAILHGGLGYWTHWWTVVQEWGRDVPLTMDAVMPALPGFSGRNWLEFIDRRLLRELTADDWMRIRIVMPSDALDGEAVDLVDLLLAHGGEVRILDVPVWFTTYGERYAVVPMRADDVFEGYCRLVRDPVTAGLYAREFSRLWARAVPWDRTGSTASGDILALLARGLHDHEIAVELGLSERTVRRRIAEEMARHGALTRFQLGTMYAGPGPTS